MQKWEHALAPIIYRSVGDLLKFFRVVVQICLLAVLHVVYGTQFF